MHKDVTWQKQGDDCKQQINTNGDATGPSGRLADSARTMTQKAVARTERGKDETTDGYERYTNSSMKIRMTAQPGRDCVVDQATTEATNAAAQRVWLRKSMARENEM